MPSHLIRHRTQKALLWRVTGTDEFGRFTYEDEYEEILVRWEDRFGYTSAPTGQVTTKVATLHVDTEIEVGSLIWKGSEEELEAAVPGTGSGPTLRPVSGLFQVVNYSEAKDIRGRSTRRQIDLNYFMDTFPDG